MVSTHARGILTAANCRRMMESLEYVRVKERIENAASLGNYSTEFLHLSVKMVLGLQDLGYRVMTNGCNNVVVSWNER